MINHQNFGNPNQQTQVPPGFMLVPDPRMQAQNRMGLGQMIGAGTQITQPSGPPIPARMTTGLEDIRPNEVPSDGTVALFMRGDYKEIYAKAVNSSGTIDTVTYVPVIPQNEQPIIEDKSKSLDVILERLERIESKVDRVTSYNRINGKTNYRKNHWKNEKEEKGENHEQSEQHE